VQESEKPFAVACRVGRLVELRVGMVSARVQLQQLQIAFADVLGRLKDPIACADLRLARVLPSDLAEASLGIMRSDNQLFHMIAILVASPMLALQIARLTREASNPRRRMFEMAPELEVWLKPHLSQGERERLHDFLAQDPSVMEEPPPTVPTGSSPHN
jgi:hypothetical protein